MAQSSRRGGGMMLTTTKGKPLFLPFWILILGTFLFSSALSQTLDEAEPNNMKEEANELKLGESIKGLIQTSDDRDWFKLNVEASDRNIIRMDLSGVSGVNLFLELFDSTGKRLTRYDVGIEGEAESVINFGVTEGFYYVLVDAREFNEKEGYTLTTALVGPWQVGMEFESNDTSERANPLKPGQRVQGYFYPDYDQDWHKVSPGEAGKSVHKISLSAVPELDTMIEVYDKDGRSRLIRHNRGRTSEPEIIINLGTSQEDYYVSVRCPSRRYNKTDQYTLLIETVGPWQEGMEFEPNSWKEAANTLKLDEPVSGYIYPERDIDWYSFTVPQPGLDIMVVELSGLENVNTRLDLLDSDGNRLKRADSGWEGAKEMIVRMRVKPGQYYVNVFSGHENADKEYTLRVGKPNVPPATGEEVNRALAKGLDYLASQQTAEGNWPGSYGTGAGVTGLGLMAFLGAECVPKDYSPNIKKAISFLKTQYHPSSDYQPDSKDSAMFGGFIGDDDPMYTHSIATLALIEAIVDRNELSLEPVVEDALQLIIRSQNTEHKPAILGGPINPDARDYGGWRYEPDSVDADISVTGWVILALKAAYNAGFTIPDWTLQKAAQFIRKCFNERDQAFAYQVGGSISCSRTGTGMLSLQMCGFPQDSLIPQAARFMQNNAPVWEEESPGSWPFYYWYYGTRAMLNAGGDDWRIWKDWMCRLLVDNQKSSGCWEAAEDEERVGEVYTTALGALMLELCCGQVPIYMRRLGNLSVSMEGGPEAAAAVPRTIELILDASNSMWGQIQKIPKIEIAKEVLSTIVQGLPDDVDVGLRIYGHQHSYKRQNCTDSELVVPVGQVNKELLIQKIKAITPRGMTPIAYSLEQAGSDLKGKKGEKVLILVSDGEESCGGDPVAAANNLNEAGLQVKMHVVGFDIEDEATREQLKGIAEITAGKYFDAAGAEELQSALKEAVRLTYTVYDADGEEIFQDFVGGETRRLKVGTYKIIINTEPPTVVENIDVEQSQEAVLILKKLGREFKVEVKKK
jgi:hypothetical protein